MPSAWTNYHAAKLPLISEWVVMFTTHKDERFLLEHPFHSQAEAEGFIRSADFPDEGGRYSVWHFDRQRERYIQVTE